MQSRLLKSKLQLLSMIETLLDTDDSFFGDFTFASIFIV